MAKPYRLTARRKAALRKAQLASARKRKNRRKVLIGAGVLSVAGLVYAGSKVYSHSNGDVAKQVLAVAPEQAKPKKKDKVKKNKPKPEKIVREIKRVKRVASPAKKIAAQTVKQARILITGSRDWSDTAAIHNALEGQLAEHGSIIVVHGAARGADSIAGAWAQRKKAAGFKVDVEAHPANWNAHGRAAGPIRNQKMVDLGADVVLAFPLGRSVGTRHTMGAARKARIKVIDYG